MVQGKKIEYRDDEIISILKSQREVLLAKITKLDNAIKALDENIILIHHVDNLDNPAIEIPTSYSTDLSYSKKVLFLLSTQPNGLLVEDMVGLISSKDGNKDFEVIKHRLTQTASNLFRAKKINAIKEGNKYRYSIKKLT